MSQSGTDMEDTPTGATTIERPNSHEFMCFWCLKFVLKVFDETPQRSLNEVVVFFSKNLAKDVAVQTPPSSQQIFHPKVVILIILKNLYNRIGRDKAKEIIFNWIDLKVEVSKLTWLLRKNFVWLIGLNIWIDNLLRGSNFSKLFDVHSLFGLFISVAVKLRMENALTRILSLYLYSLFFIY
ncbi:unnamed protein product [Vicia faba]|uniref:Uncharacterized protein n=1 Tax=Vicia faba TaxID=3906 RepID=A0AAV0YBS0_VICFA|nr:unnamed protein product [Vicia faba]